MLVINNTKKEPVVFEWKENDSTELLQITQMTVGDRIKLNEIHAKLLDGKLKDNELNERYAAARLICSIKNEAGEYFFEDSPEKVLQKVSGDVLFTLLHQLSLLNPVQTGTLEDAKK